MNIKLIGEMLALIGTLIALTNYYLVSRGKILGTSKIFNMNVLMACSLFFTYGIIIRAVMGAIVPGVYMVLSSITLVKKFGKDN